MIRLVTAIHERVNHLLFASVELLPAEMPTPPAPAGGGFYQNFGSIRLCAGRMVLPVGNALKWYGDLWEGNGQVPDAQYRVAAGPLDPEPSHKGFSIPSVPPPFSPAWHRRPRIHRLIPIGDLAEPVATLRDGCATVEAWIRARAWLREHIHFDLLAYDEWLGSGVLIAPDPLLRACRMRIASREPNGETIEVGGSPRRGADLSTLRVIIEEQRAGATAWRAEAQPDTLGRMRATAPSEVDTVRQQLVCSLRGLLDQQEPSWFIRGVWSGEAGEVRRRRVEPPRRAPKTEPLEVLVRPKVAGLPKPALTPLRQLERLQRAQAERTGDLRPIQSQIAQANAYLFERDRAHAVALIRRLVARAREQVLFVDPYLEADDLQEFAMAAENEGVSIRGLINPRPGRTKKLEEGGDLSGDLLVQQIQRMRDPAQGFGAVDIRVSTSRRLHDRFLRIDDSVWHCGHSFNQVGKGEISLMTLVTEAAEIRRALAEAYAEGEPFEIQWANRTITPRSFRQALGSGLRVLANWVERPRKQPSRRSQDD